MDRSDLIELCAPMEPEEVLRHLQELTKALDDSAFGYAADVEAVAAGVKVLKAVLPGDPESVPVDNVMFELIDGILAGRGFDNFLEVCTREGTLANALEVLCRRHALQPKVVIEWYGEVVSRRTKALQEISTKLKECTKAHD